MCSQGLGESFTQIHFCTIAGTDIGSCQLDGWRVPVDPIPEWVLQRRREIGSRVRDARVARELTQEQLGNLVGLDRKTVNRLETGAYSTLLDHLLLIAKELHVPAGDLLR